MQQEFHIGHQMRQLTWSQNKFLCLEEHCYIFHLEDNPETKDCQPQHEFENNKTIIEVRPLLFHKKYNKIKTCFFPTFAPKVNQTSKGQTY